MTASPGEEPVSRRRAFGLLAAAAAGGAVFGTAVDELLDGDGGPITFQDGEGSGTVALERDGAEGIRSVSGRSGWADEPPVRLRISRASPDQRGGQHLLVLPYEFGMAIEYDGVVECWVDDWSIHHNEHGGNARGARLWVGNDDDTGGVHVTARHTDDERFGLIAAQLFGGESGGDLRLVVRDRDDAVEVRSGAVGEERTVLRVGAAIGLDVRGRVTARGGLAVGDAQRAKSLGELSHRVPLRDERGELLGYLPVHTAR